MKKEDKVALLGGGIGATGLATALSTQKSSSTGKKAIKDAAWEISDNAGRIKYLKRNIGIAEELKNNPNLKQGGGVVSSVGKIIRGRIKNPIAGGVIDIVSSKIKKVKDTAEQKLSQELPKMKKELSNRENNIQNLIKNKENITSKYKNVIKLNKAGKILAGTGAVLGTGALIYKKQKNHSNLEEQRDSRFMRNSGKVLLGGAGTLGAAAAYHAGQSIRLTSKGAKELSRVKSSISSGNGNLKKVVEEHINKNVPIGGEYINRGINTILDGRKNLTGSTVGKIELGTKIVNRASRLPRFVTNNAHLAVEKGVREFKEVNRGKLTKRELQALDRIAPATKNLGRGVTYLKNAKFIGKGAAALGAAGGFMYINGRMLESSDRGANIKRKR